MEEEELEMNDLSHKDKFINKLRQESGNEEQEFTDDELFQESGNRWDALKADYNSQKETIDKLGEVMSEDPELSLFINEIVSGTNPIEAIAKIYGDIDDLLDDDQKASYNEARQSKLDSFGAYTQSINEQDANLENYDKELDQYCTNNGYDETQKEEIHQQIISLANDFSAGKISMDVIDVAAKALNYDDDIEEAAETGLVEGRNQKIDIELKETKKKKKGDGVPDFDSGKGGEQAPKSNTRKNSGDSFFEGFPKQ